MDLCVLEFCKLFADTKGTHHWRKVVGGQPQFLAGLLAELTMTAVEFDEYIGTMKLYRDKFIAHLDDELVAHTPKLGPAKTAVAYLFDYLLKFEDEGDFFADAGGSAADFYSDREEEANAAYK